MLALPGPVVSFETPCCVNSRGSCLLAGSLTRVRSFFEGQHPLTRIEIQRRIDDPCADQFRDRFPLSAGHAGQSTLFNGGQANFDFFVLHSLVMTAGGHAVNAGC